MVNSPTKMGSRLTVLTTAIWPPVGQSEALALDGSIYKGVSLTVRRASEGKGKGEGKGKSRKEREKNLLRARSCWFFVGTHPEATGVLRLVWPKIDGWVPLGLDEGLWH